ncbi:sulfotransferase domain-containing protein [Crocosphaera sp. Alani8]|uniref:sulfotransferase domain-containing protein n=1 Tax=Crocosphaera sp. Alani8 TaxID=3038952 RepID=UPI00313E196D
MKKKDLSKAYRILTSPIRKLPDFLIIGVAKGGTTSLHKYINNHPKVIPSTVKEPGYFLNGKYPNHSIYWYKSHFPLSNFITRSNKLTGEGTPGYIHSKNAPNWIKSTMPQVKLIALLRNPVTRAYSHFSMKMQKKGMKKSELTPAFIKEVKRELEILRIKQSPDEPFNKIEPTGHFYLSGGIYVSSIKRWIDTFSRKQILILKSEDLFEKPEKTMQKVFNFLDLPDYKGDYPVYNGGNYLKLDSKINQELSEFFKPYNESLSDYLEQDFNWI